MGRPQKRGLTAAWFVTALLASQATAESDVLLQAVSFAITGRDNAKVQPIDRGNCVFRIDSDVFRLNNVQVDRLVIHKSPYVRDPTADDPSAKAIRKAIGGHHDYPVDVARVVVTVELHGNAPVYEAGDLFRDAGFDVPAYTTGSNEHILKLTTSEGDRVNRAWQYIYSHECVGQKSPF